MFSAGLIALVADLVMMVAFAGVLFWLNWRLALIAMVVVPAMAGAAIVFRWKVRDAFRVVRVKIARINAHLQETITGMRVVQLFAREQRNLDEFMAHQSRAPRRLVLLDPVRVAALRHDHASRAT